MTFAKKILQQAVGLAFVLPFCWLFYEALLCVAYLDPYRCYAHFCGRPQAAQFDALLSPFSDLNYERPAEMLRYYLVGLLAMAILGAFVLRGDFRTARLEAARERRRARLVDRRPEVMRAKLAAFDRQITQLQRARDVVQARLAEVSSVAADVT